MEPNGGEQLHPLAMGLVADSSNNCSPQAAAIEGSTTGTKRVHFETRTEDEVTLDKEPKASAQDPSSPPLRAAAATTVCAILGSELR
jgi:hypothetical protein